MIDGDTLSGGTVFDTDVCVVGSGAGGAVAAWELARRGKRVLLIEEGGHYRAPDFTGNGMEMIGRLYRDAGMVATTSLPFIQIPHGRCIGGTTVVNCGSSFRLPAKYYGKPGFPEPDDLAPFFAEVEGLLGIRPADPAVAARQNLLLRDGAEKLGYTGGFIPRNAPTCAGSGNCNLGCPNGAKLSMEASFVPWAEAKGAEVVHSLRAERILPSSRGVEVRCRSRAKGTAVRVVARDVFVAAGALHTPNLLRASELRGLSRHCGENLTIHPTSGISGEFADVVDLWKGAPQAYYVDQFADEGVLFEGVGMTADLAALSVPLHGKDHARFMARLRHMASIGLMVSDEPVGSVRRRFGQLQISYPVTDDVVARMRLAFTEGARMMLAAGAERVWLAIAGAEPIESLEDLERRDLSGVGARDMHWNAFHPLGTCRVGPTVKDGVVDSFGRVHGQDHVWISDGSVFPASTQVNPQLSIMAFSLRAARSLAS